MASRDQSPSEKGSRTEITEKQAPTKVSNFRLVWDQALITPEILDWPYEGAGTTEEPFIVTWIENDPRDAQNFSNLKKWSLTMLAAMITMSVALISSAYSATIPEIMAEFHVSQTVATLGISLYVLGFAIGPLVWAPLSELYGRQLMFFLSQTLLTIFNSGAAGSNNIATLLVLRFLAGAFGAAPITNGGAVVADLFSAEKRGVAMTFFAAAPSLGPVLGPIIGGFLGDAAGWRWVQGFMGAFSGTVWIVSTPILPETYSVYLLRKRAEKLSHLTGKVYRSRSEIRLRHMSAVTQITTALYRPWVLFFHEPIVIILSIYLSVIYGTLYLLFGAYPVVYEQVRGWSISIGSLAFIGILVGSMSALVYSFWDNARYVRASRRHNGHAPPEARLPPVMVGGVAFPIGLFWFAWTNSPNIHWMVSISAGAVFSFGMILVFLCLNYLVDAYTIYAASVIASTTVLRSLCATAFPLFTGKMYEKLGIHWASSVPAFLGLACMPFPFLFYKYGVAIRKRCKYAGEVEQLLQETRATVVRSNMPRIEEGAGETRLERQITRDLERDGEKDGSIEKEKDLDSMEMMND
ncbi:putative MFS transporter [Mytilinidion resinicola]|uniref:MFS transporter n=1 Tax=Mytilinidion resinicola TaxID=574789 RepID=A0A6A6YCI6_9PEZI|nr:putative MFS transporter [Mytilinidion resinicola]KAF2806546.1 putative MFS transporter [Mytilinidion resinicola]